MQTSYTVAMDKIMKEIGGSRERDQFTAVLESIQSDFQAFGEKLDMVDERLSTRIDMVEAGLGARIGGAEEGLGAKIDRLTEDVEFIKNEIAEIRLEMAEIRKELGHKADTKRIEELERRVSRIEAMIAKK
ncbi:MAG: hypothetical protein Q8P49_02980 [Candidatus Liptonbacteria bacterium]|nr:hypothetical protein [Candidatus Liptonbacteria bacterium]